MEKPAEQQPMDTTPDAPKFAGALPGDTATSPEFIAAFEAECRKRRFVAYNMVPEEVRTVVLTRPARETTTGKDEMITTTRFSLFLPDAARAVEFAVNAIVVSVNADQRIGSTGHKFVHADMLFDDETVRIVEQFEVDGIRPDALLLRVPMSIDGTVFRTTKCHACGEVIATTVPNKSGLNEPGKMIYTCSGCHSYARYCDAKCAARAWRLGHSVLCRFIRERIEAARACAAEHAQQPVPMAE
ncbi:MAG: zinc finger MYND domain-containing protein [Candidatus Omnitrophota bacterium]